MRWWEVGRGLLRHGARTVVPSAGEPDAQMEIRRRRLPGPLLASRGPNAVLDAALRAADTGRAMSQENVELAQQAFDAFNRRDLGAFLALMDADVEALSRLVAMEGGYHGHDGIRLWWQNLFDALPD